MGIADSTSGFDPTDLSDTVASLSSLCCPARYETGSAGSVELQVHVDQLTGGDINVPNRTSRVRGNCSDLVLLVRGNRASQRVCDH